MTDAAHNVTITSWKRKPSRFQEHKTSPALFTLHHALNLQPCHE